MAVDIDDYNVIDPIFVNLDAFWPGVQVEIMRNIKSNYCRFYVEKTLMMLQKHLQPIILSGNSWSLCQKNLISIDVNHIQRI